MNYSDKATAGCLSALLGAGIGVYLVRTVIAPNLPLWGGQLFYIWIAAVFGAVIGTGIVELFIHVDLGTGKDSDSSGTDDVGEKYETRERERQRRERERQAAFKRQEEMDAYFGRKNSDAERVRQEQNARDELNRRRQEAALAAKKLNRRRQEAAVAAQKRREERFLRYLFSMLSKLAKVDGHVDASEVKTAQRVFDRFEFAAKRRKFCTDIFNEAKDNTRSIFWYAEQFGNQVTDNEVCTYVYELLWDVACADGWLHPKEKEILQGICQHLHIPSSYYSINYRRRSGIFKEGCQEEEKHQSSNQQEQQPKRRHEWRKPYVSGHSSILEAYEILECDMSATDAEVRSAYRKVAKRYHPDCLRQNGVPEEMIARETERMAQVNAAWGGIKRSRGI